MTTKESLSGTSAIICAAKTSEKTTPHKDTHPDTIENVFQQLQGMKPWCGRLPTRAKWERAGRFLSDRLIPFTLMLTAAFLTVVCIQTILPSRNNVLLYAALAIWGLLTLLMVAWLLLGPIQDGLRMLTFRDKAYRRTVLERRHDLFNVAELHCYSDTTLDVVERILKLQQERIGRRISAFLGGPDKLALFGLVGLGWAAWEKFGAKNPEWQSSFLIYPIAFFVGIAVGALLLQRVNTRQSYHLELLTLAKLYQQQRGCLDRFHTVQPLPRFLPRQYVNWVFGFGKSD